MSVKRRKQIMVDTSVLKDWMKKRKMNYRDLANETGMSVTQAFNLTRQQLGGSITLGYLVPLNIPNLFYLAEIEEKEGRKKIADVKHLELRTL